MLFVCKRCNFIFSRTERPDTCPDCSCELINDAGKEEQEQYERFAKESKDNKDK